jgi:hypothetical protein
MHAQQTHVLMQSVGIEVIRKIRRRHFHSLFPQAAEEDYAAIARVAEREAFADLADLERAGTWLVRFAQAPDNFQRQRMADRWQAVCQRSAHLGLGCYRTYQRIAPQFGFTPAKKKFGLWLACAVRLGSGSRLERALNWAMQKSERPGLC